MIKKVYVATNIRGFLVDLMKASNKKTHFIWQQSRVYEYNSRLKLVLAKLVKSRLGDYLGIIQRIVVNDNNHDAAFSYNRFLKSKKPYVIYLENPPALYHYCLRRNKTFIGKRKVQKYLNDPKLYAIVCMSKACEATLHKFYTIPDTLKVLQIYPLVATNQYTTVQTIERKSTRDYIECLYVSSDFNLKGGKEIIECFERLRARGITNVHLTIITKINKIEKELMLRLQKMDNVNVLEFNLTKDELFKVYASSNILLHPTRQDSFPLVVLEAAKAGNVIVASDLYGIPEIVKDGYNGFLLSPIYRFFNNKNMPNEKVWNNRKETIYSDYVDRAVVDRLELILVELLDDRKKLKKMALNSFEHSRSNELNESFIIERWNELFEEIGIEEGE